MRFNVTIPIQSIKGAPVEVVTSRITELTLTFMIESPDIGSATHMAQYLMQDLGLAGTLFNIELVVAASGPYEEHALHP